MHDGVRLVKVKENLQKIKVILKKDKKCTRIKSAVCHGGFAHVAKPP